MLAHVSSGYWLGKKLLIWDQIESVRVTSYVRRRKVMELIFEGSLYFRCQDQSWNKPAVSRYMEGRGIIIRFCESHSITIINLTIHIFHIS